MNVSSEGYILACCDNIKCVDDQIIIFYISNNFQQLSYGYKNLIS